MQHDGYILYDKKEQKIAEVLQRSMIDENGCAQIALVIPSTKDVVHCPKPGQEFDGFLFLESWREENPPPSIWHRRIGSASRIEGDKFIQGHLYEDDPSLYPTADDVNAERGRRTEKSFPYLEKEIQFRPPDRENINGASSLAIIAIVNGAQPGDYQWTGAGVDFEWITADNSLLKLDAFQTLEMGKVAAAWKSKHIFQARELKNQSPIPRDYTDDKYWT